MQKAAHKHDFFDGKGGGTQQNLSDIISSKISG